ncbi:hypothetical protein EE36_00175 [Sulfitobacter sp. EE-36]|nr:hypothetical protein EE36_00175 [Sulfitobacter sp. EE-36]
MQTDLLQTRELILVIYHAKVWYIDYFVKSKLR